MKTGDKTVTKETRALMESEPQADGPGHGAVSLTLWPPVGQQYLYRTEMPQDCDKYAEGSGRRGF